MNVGGRPRYNIDDYREDVQRLYETGESYDSIIQGDAALMKDAIVLVNKFVPTKAKRAVELKNCRAGPDEELMQLVDVANVACGYHAGDPSTMMKTIRLAKQHGVRVGAHPGLPDLLGFGRRQMAISPEDMYSMVIYQVGALGAMLAAEGMQLNHVKPHGELYFYVQRDAEILDAVLRAVRVFRVPIYGPWTRAMTQACERVGVPLIPELYVDIDYDADGRLVPVAKSAPATPDSIRRRVLDFAAKDEVTCSAGSVVNLGFASKSFSICIHSDLSGALNNATAARDAVEQIKKAEEARE
ncbi:hypothetical protein SLS62_006509 [Diatrype stigma]|uniref:LamB/YcsF family protein n=1 Tax=Diatrype stigma TaxID=117547 RepID=A0AAN9UYG4_9PEZI